MDCPICGFAVANARGLAAHFRHQAATHPDYNEWVDDRRWEGKQEGEEFVRCLECGHRADTLARHLKAAHGMTADAYRAKHGASVLIRSRALTTKRSQAIADAGQDRTGFKLVVCPSCSTPVEVHKHAGSLHDFRCDACKKVAENVRWAGKVEGVDFVTCRLCGWRGLNLTGHLMSAHPNTTGGEYRTSFPTAPWFAQDAYQLKPSANKRNFTEADLRPFMDNKGKVEVARAADALGCSWLTVLRYCRDLGLPTRNRLATQKWVLDIVSGIVGEAYEWEWSHPEITNPETGYRFYFDGYFPKANLIVEYHGKQHFKFIPEWHKTEAEFDRRVALDAEKIRQARAVGLRVVEVRFDDPLTSVDFFRGLLRAAR